MKISKKTKLLAKVMTILIILTLGLYGMARHQNMEVDSKHKSTAPIKDSLRLRTDSLKQIADSTLKFHQNIADSMQTRVKNNFDYVYSRFKSFNPDVDSSLTMLFVQAMTIYGLDSTEKQRELYTGQILLESGARHFKKDSSVITSSAGAIGLCQIMPRTCYSYILKHPKEMKYLGGWYRVTDYMFVFSEDLKHEDKVRMCKEWLKIPKNNVFMWGLITKENLKSRGNIHTQLVSYNMGPTGMKRYVNKGGSVYKHKYIKGIHRKIRIAEKGLNDHEKSS